MSQKPKNFKNREIYIDFHKKPSDRPPHYVVHCCGSSRICSVESEVIDLIQQFKLETIEEVKSFLLAQWSSRQAEQSHQEAAE